MPQSQTDKSKQAQKVREKSGSATITNRQIQTSTKGKRKVKGVPQSQTAALPRPQEEEETDKSKQAQTKQTYEKTKISSFFPSEVIAMLKGLKKHKNKMTQGKTLNKSPRRINHKATKSKINTGTASSQ